MLKQNVVWTRSEYRRVRRAVDAHRAGTPPDVLDEERELLSRLPIPGDPRTWDEAARELAALVGFRAKLWAFCAATQAVREGAAPEGSAGLARRLLEDHQVGWRKSRLAALRADLHWALAEHAQRVGDPFLAGWHALLGNGTDGARALDPGLLERAVRHSWDLLPAAVDGSGRSLRRRGRVLEARGALELEPPSTERDWEIACCETSLQGHVRPLVEHFARHGGSPRQHAVARLFAHALPERAGPVGLPEVSGGRWPLLDALVEARNTEVPLDVRVGALGRALARPEADAAIRILGLGAAARVLYGARRYAHAKLVLACHRSANRVFSGGLSDDVFRTNVDIPAVPAPHLPLEVGWRRAARSLSLVGQLGAALGASRVRRLFRPGARAKRIREQERSALARILARHAGAMKGPLVKVAQHLAYLGVELDAAALTELVQLLDAGPPMPLSSVLGVVAEELGRGPEAVFASIDPAPLGVGSIGQVHRATLRSGEEVAIKVQFPEVRAAIRQDLRVLHTLASVLRVLVPRTPWREVVREMVDQTLREADYCREAAHQESFRQAFEGHPRIRIPRVVPDLVTPRLLVMELARGESLYTFGRAGSPEARLQATRDLYELFLRPLDHPWMYADFNPGNFRFTDSEVWCLDFGCVKVWPPATYAAIRALTVSAVTRDPEGFRAAARRLDVTSDPAHFDYDRLLDQFDPESCRRHGPDGQPLPFAPADAARLVARFMALRSDQTLQPAHLYGLRAYFSFIAMVVNLGCSDEGMAIARHVVAPTPEAPRASAP